MRNSHFHPLSRNSPFAGVFIEVSPQSTPQLARTDKNKRCKTQCGTDDRGTDVTVDCSQEISDLLRNCDGREMPLLRGRQCAAQVSGRIPLGSTGGDGISKDAATILMGTVRGIERTAFLNTAQAP